MQVFYSLPRFVLCSKCDNPETVIKVNSKRGILSSSCKACGHVFQLDSRHKLTTFILKVKEPLEAFPTI